uniref:Uncharacterized protein n=1 Tax=Parascaris equorum TaxID=6256 RepID=A0A914S1Z2_PAREQ
MTPYHTSQIRSQSVMQNNNNNSTLKLRGVALQAAGMMQQNAAANEKCVPITMQIFSGLILYPLTLKLVKKLSTDSRFRKFQFETETVFLDALAEH